MLQVEGRRYVLRKKPSGRVLASAHAVEREYHVLNALQNTEVRTHPLRLRHRPDVSRIRIAQS